MHRAPTRHREPMLVAAFAVVLAAGCSNADDSAAAPVEATTPAPTTNTVPVGDASDDRFPDVIEAVATYDDESMTWAFAVTMSSPYDTPERYADGWRIVGPDGTVYGIHTLLHDHASEQPFTRRQERVEIPDDVTEVVVEGRDQQFGFGGATVTVALHTG